MTEPVWTDANSTGYPIALVTKPQWDAALAQQYEAGRVAGVEAAADKARRGSDVIRGWIKPDSSDERTDALLYSALREGQEIELVIRSLLPQKGAGDADGLDGACQAPD